MSVARHELKCLPIYFEMVWRGVKPFEWRRFDRHYKAGDQLILREWDGKGYTGREIIARITCVLGPDVGPDVGIPPGYVILGLGRSPTLIAEGRRLTLAVSGE